MSLYEVPPPPPPPPLKLLVVECSVARVPWRRSPDCYPETITLAEDRSSGATTPHPGPSRHTELSAVARSTRSRRRQTPCRVFRGACPLETKSSLLPRDHRGSRGPILGRYDSSSWAVSTHRAVCCCSLDSLSPPTNSL